MPRRLIDGLRRRARDLGHDGRGATAVEFALILPILLLLAAGVIDIGRLISLDMQVKAAAQAGVDSAQRRGWSAPSVTAAVTGAGALPVTADPAPRLATACLGAGAIQETASASCAGGGKPGSYAIVDAQAPFRPLMPWPGVPTPTVLKAEAMVRLQ
jgi:Flp pilus assembly protein TadG